MDGDNFFAEMEGRRESRYRVRMDKRQSFERHTLRHALGFLRRHTLNAMGQEPKSGM